MIKALEKTETIELAKSPRDASLLACCALITSWISEHLVDLIVKRIQVKSVVNSSDQSNFLILVTQISILRDAARQSHLRAHHYLPCLTSSIGVAGSLSNYQSLNEFMEILNKI